MNPRIAGERCSPIAASAALAMLVMTASLSWDARAAPDELGLQRMQHSVLRVEAVYRGGGISRGSAVRIDSERYATACHVLRAAQGAFLLTGRRYVPVTLLSADIEFDLCVLKALEDTGATIAPVSPEPVEIGDTVYAVGFPRGQGMEISSGRVYGRHGSAANSIIQTSAAFEDGASGGGLFDAHGRLLGVLSFRAPLRGPNFYALSPAWLEAAPAPQVRADATALWMLPIGEQPRFLQAMSLETQRDWERLLEQSKLWTEEMPTLSEAWLARGKALLRLGRLSEAGDAYGRAVALEPARLGELRRLHDLYLDAGDHGAATGLAEVLQVVSAHTHSHGREGGN